MESKCPNCGNPLDEEDFSKCPNCNTDIVQFVKNGLKNLQEEKNLISSSEEAISSKIQERIWKRIKKRSLTYLVLFSAFWTLLFGYSLLEIPKKIKTLVTEKFAEPKVKETFTEVAEKQAKTIIEDQIQPERENIEIEIGSFRTYLDTSRKNFSEKYETLAEEVTFLKERNRLLRLGDKAITDGDRKALAKLVSIAKKPPKPELFPAVSSEILRVKSFYITVTRIKGASITHTKPDGTKMVDDEIPTNILIEDLKHNAKWVVRAKSAQLLKARKEKGVPEALLYALRNDQQLDVIKIALDSFESVTRFKATDVFACESAEKWWKQNKQEVDKKLKEQ